MKSILNSRHLEPLLVRLYKLTPDHPARWGKMSASQVLPHMADPLRAALGDRPVPLAGGLFGKWPFNLIVIQFLPWPRGASTAPEFIQGKKGTPTGLFEQDRQALILLIQRFSKQPADKPFMANPVFGNLSNKTWGKLMWRHIDHHLRQFGL